MTPRGVLKGLQSAVAHQSSRTDAKTLDQPRVPATASEESIDVVAGGHVLDFISGTENLKETPKEQVRQRIARALFHEYGISVEDMEADFPVSVGGRNRRVDIAIFRPGQPHAQSNLRRVVICRPEPAQSKRGAVKMRDQDTAWLLTRLPFRSLWPATRCRWNVRSNHPAYRATTHRPSPGSARP